MTKVLYLKERRLDSLEKSVNKHLEDGWNLVGGVVPSFEGDDVVYVQTIEKLFPKQLGSERYDPRIAEIAKKVVGSKN